MKTVIDVCLAQSLVFTLFSMTTEWEASYKAVNSVCLILVADFFEALHRAHFALVVIEFIHLSFLDVFFL